MKILTRWNGVSRFGGPRDRGCGGYLGRERRVALHAGKVPDASRSRRALLRAICTGAIAFVPWGSPLSAATITNPATGAPASPATAPAAVSAAAVPAATASPAAVSATAVSAAVSPAAVSPAALSGSPLVLAYGSTSPTTDRILPPGNPHPATISTRGSLEALCEDAQALIAQGNVESRVRAVELLEAYTRLYGDSSRFRMALGEVLYHSNRPANAMEQFNRALKLDPDNLYTRVRLARLLLANPI